MAAHGREADQQPPLEQAEGALPAHHVQKRRLFGPRYRNPWNVHPTRTCQQAAQWRVERNKLGVRLAGHLLNNKHPKPEDLQRAFPVHPIDWRGLADTSATHPDSIQLVWIGHASMLVRMGGATFLTDPVLSKRASPLSWIGPKRSVPTPLKPRDPNLSRLDFVLISHNHFDHLDNRTVDLLHLKFSKALTWYVPLGVKRWFERRGIKGNVVEMDWWQEAVHPASGLRITMTPAIHWSARGMFDQYHSLWGGYHVRSGGSNTQRPLSFWFAGDSAYLPQPFHEIRQRLGPVDLAAIPIGAYAPRWFNKEMHCNVEEAMQIAADVGARRAIGVHCCTFALTDEPLDEPPTRLARLLAESGQDPWSFVTLQHGERLAVAAGGQLLNRPQLLGTDPEAQETDRRNQQAQHKQHTGHQGPLQQHLDARHNGNHQTQPSGDPQLGSAQQHNGLPAAGGRQGDTERSAQGVQLQQYVPEPSGP